jgi:general nucleoside transport system permease protein
MLVYVALLLVPAFAFVLNRTTYGTKIKAVGENPAAADSLGVSVNKIRYSTVILGSALAGLAGAALALELGIFQSNLTQGEGFIAVALVYFGAWRPYGVLAGSLLYGLVAAVVLTWKTLGIIPPSASALASMAPALITVVALVFVARRVRQPAALAKAYERGG